jgi:regulatory protein
MLARKGYGGGLAAAVVREALDAADDEDSDAEQVFAAYEDQESLLP